MRCTNQLTKLGRIRPEDSSSAETSELDWIEKACLEWCWIFCRIHWYSREMQLAEQVGLWLSWLKIFGCLTQSPNGNCNSSKYNLCNAVLKSVHMTWIFPISLPHVCINNTISSEWTQWHILHQRFILVCKNWQQMAFQMSMNWQSKWHGNGHRYWQFCWETSGSLPFWKGPFL